jgi:photosystem II stability/assembly factor-like uncharacterized protein
LAALALALAGAVGAASAQVTPGSVITTLTLFAGNPDGLWVSRDWGGSWELVRAPGLAELGAAHVIQPIGPRVWLGGTGGLFVSEDFGATWARRGELRDVRSLQASRYPAADPTIFVGTAAGLAKSTDDGARFESTVLRGATVTRLDWPGPALVVATDRGLRVSPDGGQTWRGAPAGLPEGQVQALALSSYFAVDPVMFAAVGAEGLQRSTDGGVTWAPTVLKDQRVNDVVWLGPILYAGTESGLMRSEDAGRNFTRIGEGLGEADVRTLLFPLAPDSGAEFFVGTDRGVFRTLDGGLRFERTGFKEAVSVLATFPPPAPPSKPKR